MKNKAKILIHLAVILFSCSIISYSQDAVDKAPKPAQEEQQLPSANMPDSEMLDSVKEEMPADSETSAFVPEAAPITKDTMTTMQSKILDELVTLDFKNADLQNVIRLVATKTGLNVIMSQKVVKGTVTLHLENVPLRVALQNILRVNNLDYVVEESGIVRIVSRADVTTRAVEFETKIFKINWVQAADISKSIDPFVKGEGGSVTVDSGSNSLIIDAPPPVVKKVDKLIYDLDLPEKQVLIEARMVDMTEDAEKKLGIQWGVTGTSTTTDDLGNIVTVGTKTLDVFLPQANWLEGAEITGTFSDYFYQLQLLEDRNLVETIASPKVVTLNNLPAEMHIIKKHPYIESVTQAGSSSNIVGEVEFEESGVDIVITPNITNNGYVKMKVFQSHKIYRGKESEIPVIDERRATTNVIVQDENIVIIGGIRQLQRADNKKAIPWVYQAPVIGWLFKNQDTTIDKLEMVLFVKPSIIKDPALTYKEELQYDIIEENWHLPDYFFDKVDIDKTPYNTEAYFEELEESEDVDDADDSAEE